MAKTEGDAVLDADQEEIALSDSELDNVLKSAEITDESSAEQEDNLEQYGVWVKVEPQNIEGESEQNMDFELSDLETGSEAALTEEEEQLLGELEEDEDSDLGDLSGLEDDLEELGKGGAFAEDSVEEELSVEDLDVDLEELSDEALSIPEDSDLDSLPDFEAGDELSLEMGSDTEIEVPLSDSAIVEEHYEDLAPVEGVPSTPGQAPPKDSSNILEKIERDLNQIRLEIQSLKNELAGLGKGGKSAGGVDVAPAPAGADGFFEKGEDETIALTGDELDNILNTADVTEEVEAPEEIVESLDIEELPEQDLGVELAEEAAAPAEEEIMELGSLDLEEGEVSGVEMEDAEESIEIDIGGTGAEEELSLDGELESLSLEEPGVEAPGEELEELEELSLEETDLEASPEELSLEEPAEELELEELETLSLEEPVAEAEAPVEELSLEEPVEEPETLSLEDAGTDELEELELEEAPADELETLSLDEPGLEPVEDFSLVEAEDAGGGDEDVLTLDALEEDVPEAEEAADLELAAEQLTIPEEEEQLPAADFDAGIAQSGTESMSDDLKSEIKSVLSYFDQLLENLPEEKIKEFAQSEYFVRYKRLFEELGLGA